MRDFWVEAIKQLGMSAVLCFMLTIYYQSESRRWDDRMKADETRWNTLFEQSRADNTDALRAVEACCNRKNSQ